MSTVVAERTARSYTETRMLLCGDCGRLSRAGSACCWRCGEDSLAPISPVGEIYAFTNVCAEGDSFLLALVELTCGKLVTARIVDDGGELRIGLPVVLETGSSLETPASGLHFSPLAAT